MIYLKESKEDIRKFTDWIIKRLIQVEDLSKEDASEVARTLVDRFLNMKSRLKNPYNDLYYWIKLDDVEELENYLNNLDAHIKSKEDTKQKAKDGARLVYSDDNWKVYEITTYEASAKYGKNTKWCITGSKRWSDRGDGRDFWDGYYSKDGVRFYFFIKSNDEKYALAIYPGDKYCEIYNNEDVQIPFIPNAPLIDEIKVNYSDNSPGNILINAIMTKKLPENVLFQVFEEVLYDNTGFNVEIYSRTTFKDFISAVSNMIPEGFIEYGSVENDILSVDEYERITGEKFISGGWGGDISPLTDLFAYQGNTKEEVLNTIASNEHSFDYFVIDEDYEGYQLIFIKDWVELFLYANSKSNVNDWSEFDIDEFFENNELGGSRASIFAVMCANQLIADIKSGEISKNVLYNIPNLPNDFIASIKESFDNLLKEDDKVSRIVKNDANIFYHGSVEDISDSLNKPINWITKDYNYAKTFALDSGYVYTCEATLGNLFDVGKTDARVYDLLPIKPYRLSREFEAIVRKLNISENIVDKLLENVINEYNLEASGYKLMIRPVVRSVAFKRILESLGYNGIKAIEYDSVNNKDVETFGLFDNVKVIDRKKVNESLKEDDEELVGTFNMTKEELETYLENDVNYSTPLSSPASNGPMIVLSDGSIYDVSSYETHPMFAGAFADSFDTEYDYDKFSGGFDSEALDYLQDVLGVVTLNPGDHAFEDRLKIVAGIKPTNEQFDVIRDFIDIMQSRFDADTILYVYIGPYFNTYRLGTYTSDEFVKKFRLAFVRGRLEESRKAITWGDLDYAKKTDTRKMMGGRGTGHFGTGFYFVGKDGPYGIDANGKIKGYDYEPSRPIYEIDLDAYNLFKPKDNDSAYKLHDTLKLINGGYEPSLDKWLTSNLNEEDLDDELYNLGWTLVDEDFDDDIDLDFDDLDALLDKDEESKDYEDSIKEQDKSLDNYRKLVKEFIAKYELEDYVWKDIDTLKTGEIENHVIEAIHEKFRSLANLEYALDTLSEMFNVSKENLLNIIHKAYESNSEDSISTLVMKGLGYEGVDVTHLNHDAQGLSGLDNFGYGTVVYDLKPGTFKRILEPRKNDSGHHKSNENLKDEVVNEAMKGRNSLTDERVKKYVEECIEKMKTINYGLIDQDALTFDDIDVEEGDSTRTFGVMQLPKDDFSNFKLILNKHMFEESEEAIKNTIYHELCHYVVDKLAIAKDIFYNANGSWYMRTRLPFAKNYRGHGAMWKNIARIVGNATNQNIQRTGDYEMHTGVGKHAEDSYKYIVKCKHCGNEFKYSRMSPFIKDVITHDGHSEDWYCTCNDGTKSHDFEIVKGK